MLKQRRRARFGGAGELMCGRTALYLEPDQIMRMTGIDTWMNSSNYHASYNGTIFIFNKSGPHILSASDQNGGRT